MTGSPNIGPGPGNSASRGDRTPWVRRISPFSLHILIRGSDRLNGKRTRISDGSPERLNAGGMPHLPLGLMHLACRPVSQRRSMLRPPDRKRKSMLINQGELANLTERFV